MKMSIGKKPTGKVMLMHVERACFSGALIDVFESHNNNVLHLVEKFNPEDAPYLDRNIFVFVQTMVQHNEFMLMKDSDKLAFLISFLDTAPFWMYMHTATLENDEIGEFKANMFVNADQNPDAEDAVFYSVLVKMEEQGNFDVSEYVQ